MSSKISDKDQALNQLANVCYSNPSEADVEKSFADLKGSRFEDQARMIVHHPLYDTALKIIRLQALREEPGALRRQAATYTGEDIRTYEASEHALSNCLGDRFNPRIWGFKRRNGCSKTDHLVFETLREAGKFPTGVITLTCEYLHAEKEICLQYARPKRENPLLDELFGLAKLCSPTYAQGKCQYSFWIPDLDDNRILRWNVDGEGHLDGYDKSDPGAIFKWASNKKTWTRLLADGEWDLHETRNFDERTLSCSDTHDPGSVFKSFVPCTMAEISQVLFRLWQKRYEVFQSSSNLVLRDPQDLMGFGCIKIDSPYVKYAVIYASNDRDMDTLLIKIKGVWVTRKFEAIPNSKHQCNDCHGDKMQYCKNWPWNYSWSLSDGSSLNLSAVPPTFVREGRSFPVERSLLYKNTHAFGTQFHMVDKYGEKKYRGIEFRTISPVMICPEEAEKMIGVVTNVLQNSGGFSAPLIRLTEEYWNLEALTLPKEW